MTATWVTTGSTTVEAVVNPLAAACDSGFVPEQVHLLSNPGTAHLRGRTTDLLETVVGAHAGEAPDIDVTSLDAETDFPAVVAHFRAAIERARETGSPVAVDVTPGRKFMSAIAFQAGIQFEADHVYYLYLHSGAYYGRVYPDIPRTAVDLIDFTEVV